LPESDQPACPDLFGYETDRLRVLAGTGSEFEDVRPYCCGAAAGGCGAVGEGVSVVTILIATFVATLGLLGRLCKLHNLPLTRCSTGGSKQTRTADPLLVRQVL
jgi:hypothetical protein